MDCWLCQLHEWDHLQSLHTDFMCSGVLHRHHDILPVFERHVEYLFPIFCHQRPSFPHQFDCFLTLPAFYPTADVRGRGCVCSAQLVIIPARSFMALQKWSYCRKLTRFCTCILLMIFVYGCIQKCYYWLFCFMFKTQLSLITED